jgi:A/G-specific adenine glycosylase
MLQQTQVTTVIPYYLRFIQRFPNVSALASARLDDVLQHWAGLGYYARARNLHRAAGVIMDRHAGILPDSLEEILKLPGIGAYTAGAILSIAYDQCFAAVDANVIRVLCRVFGITGDPKSNATQRSIRGVANLLVPHTHAGEYNQALMELGALVCDPADPRCEECPLVSNCAAGNSSNPTDLPEYAAVGATTSVVHSCVVIQNDRGERLVIQRPAHGLWGGLWEFPRVVCNAGELPEHAAIRAGLEVAGIELTAVSKLTVVKHTVTRYRITLHAFTASVADDEDLSHRSHKSYRSYKPNGTDQARGSQKWVPLENLCDYAFSSPQAIVRNAVLG